MSTKSDSFSFNQILNIITNLIISYEPGDVMKVSEITGDLEKLSAQYGSDSTEGRICVKLLALSRRELQDGSGGFTEAVSKGIDLLRAAAETDGPQPEREKKRTEEWLRAGEGTEASVPAGKNGSPGYGGAGGQEDDPSLIDGDQLRLFVSDCGERFSAAQDLILRLEQKPDDAEAVKELFRIFHTIKGECGFLKLAGLGLLAHNEENLLDLVRSGKLAVDRAAADFLLKGLDLARELTEYLGRGDFPAYARAPVKEFITALSQFTESRGTAGRCPAAPDGDAPPLATPTVKPPARNCAASDQSHAPASAQQSSRHPVPAARTAASFVSSGGSASSAKSAA